MDPAEERVGLPFVLTLIDARVAEDRVREVADPRIAPGRLRDPPEERDAFPVAHPIPRGDVVDSRLIQFDGHHARHKPPYQRR
jgi:hypothetical protein